MTQPARLRIAYLPFYVDYYEGICPDFPREKAEVAGRCGQMLERYGDVVWDGELLRDVEGAAAAGRRLANEDVDCVVVVTTIAVFGGIPWAALRELDLPILVWNAQQIERVEAGYSMVDIVRNTGQIGTQALANTLVRKDRWFRVITGRESGRHTETELARFFATIAAVTAMRRAKLLAIGGGFPLMTDIELDERTLQEYLGATVTHVAAEEFTAAYREVAPQRVTELLQDAAQRYDTAAITGDELARSVRLSDALQSYVESTGADAGSLNCHGGNCLRNEEIGITACYSLGEQNALGRPFTCTGDLPTALAMLLLKRLTGVAMYTEVQLMDETPDPILIANSGEGEDGLPRQGCPAAVRGNSNFTGVHGRGASFAYPLQQGPATVISLTPTPHGVRPYRIIAAEGEILEDTLPDAGALAGFFRFSHTGLHDGYTRWLEAGAVHHAATAPGHHARDVAAVAELLNIEFVGI